MPDGKHLISKSLRRSSSIERVTSPARLVLFWGPSRSVIRFHVRASLHTFGLVAAPFLAAASEIESSSTDWVPLVTRRYSFFIPTTAVVRPRRLANLVAASKFASPRTLAG